MNGKTKTKKHGFLPALLNHKCPHCREGQLFKDKGSYHLKSFMKMNERCPVCNQQTEIEAGFYYGTGYVSYALAVAFSASTFVAWWGLIGFSADDNRVFWWLIVNSLLMLLFQPYLMRLSRVVWLSIFVHYEAGWKHAKSVG